MPEEYPYVPMPPIGRDGRPVAQADLPIPEMRFARPTGAWVVVAALFVVVVGLWAVVATLFSIRA